MPFDFEWTGRSYGDESDRERGLEAAQESCAKHEIDPAAAYRAHLEAIERGDDPPGDARSWYQIAWAAERAYCEGWENAPENFALVWR